MTPHSSRVAGLFVLAVFHSGCGAFDADEASQPGERATEFQVALTHGALPFVADESGLRLGDTQKSNDGHRASGVRVGWGHELGAPSSAPQLLSDADGRVSVDLRWSKGAFVERDGGVEQTWEIPSRPATPALEVRVPVEGLAYLGRGDDGLVFRTVAESYLLYGDGVWIDADGTRTDVPARFDGEDIVLTVTREVLDTTRFPALLDPIIGSAYSLTPTQLTYAAADQENPEVAIGATSRLVVWSDDRNGAAPGVFGTFRDETGTIEERLSFRIGTGRLTGTPLAPAVAFAGGVYAVAWATSDTVYVARVADGGGVLDASPIVVAIGSTPRTAAIATNGSEFIVGWVDSGTSGGVHAQRIATTGALVGSRIAVASDDDAHLALRIARDPAGGYWALFDEDSGGDRDLALVRIADDGTVEDTSPVAVASGFADQSRADLAFAAGGAATVVYEDSSTYAIHGITVTEGAGGALSFGTPTRISGGSGEQAPRIVHDGSGFRIAWVSSAPGTLSPQLVTIGAPARKDGETLGPGTSYRIALAVDATSVHAVWQSSNAATQATDVFRRACQRSSDTCGFGSPVLVSQAPETQLAPKVANNDTRSLVVWTQPTAGGRRLYGARVNPLGEFQDVTAFPIGYEHLDIVLAGVYTDGDNFLVAWHEKEVIPVGPYTQNRWTRRLARVSDGGVASSPFTCGPTSSSVSPIGVWMNYGALPAAYTATYVDGDVIYNNTVLASSCGSSRFLAENPAISGATALVSTSKAAYFISASGDLYRVPQSTAQSGSYAVSLGIGSDLATIDVLEASVDALVYSNSPPQYPLDQSVGVYAVGSGGTSWNIPDLATHVATTANPQVAWTGNGLFVVWRRTNNAIVGQRLSVAGDRVDRSPVSIDAEPRSRALGDIVTDFLGRSLLAYSADLPEAGWATRIRTRVIDFRYNQGNANGQVCTTGFDCDSGLCADGVCCNTVCGYSNPNDCQACAVAVGAATDGVCAPVVVPNTICRASAGECDVAEVCDGSTITCPSNSFAQPDSSCGNPSFGPCDLADRCSGTSAACVPRGFVPNGTQCGTSRGGCDAIDVCNGVAAACPDLVAKTTVVCRSAAGPCDAAESCDGVTDVCPDDVLSDVQSVCRPATGACDVEEACDGVSPACPTDVVLDATTVCRDAAGVCDVPELCNGSTGVCPLDAKVAAGTVCRAAAGECDAAEVCSGTSSTCAIDRALADGTSCGDDALACVAAVCSQGACASKAVTCSGGAVCVEAQGGCPTPQPVDPEPEPESPMSGGGCSTAPHRPNPLVAWFGLAAVWLLRARRSNRRIQCRNRRTPTLSSHEDAQPV